MYAVVPKKRALEGHLTTRGRVFGKKVKRRKQEMSKRNYRNVRTGGSSRRGGYGGARGGSYARSGNGAIKVVIGLIAAAIIAVTVCGCGYASRKDGKWFKNTDLSTWHLWGSTSTSVKSIDVDDNVIAIDNDGNPLVEGEIYAMPKGIMFMTSSKTTTPSVTVRANIKPANADDKRVTWTSEDTSEVTVTPDANNPLIATIICIRALTFGAVNVTCTSVENPEIKAVCKIDYFAKGDAVQLDAEIVEDYSDGLVFGNTYSVRCYFSTIGPGVGTYVGEVDKNSISVDINLKNEFMSRIDYYLSQNGYTGSDYSVSSNDSMYTVNCTKMQLLNSPYRCFYGGDCPEEAFDNAFKLAMRDCAVHATFTVSADYVFNGKCYGKYSCDFDVKFSQAGIWVPVDGIDLDNDNVIFGT